MEDGFISSKADREKSGLTASNRARLVASGQYPQPVRIGQRTLVWIEAETDAWRKARAAERQAELERRRALGLPTWEADNA